MSQEEGYLPLFKSPLVHDETSSIEYKGAITPPREVNDVKQIPARIAQNDDQSLHDNPQFHRHAEATTAELFYDLFFVANLTVFTAVHEVNDGDSLKQYIGFFCILWFTWYQVGLYDVRFSADSAFERVAKAFHFLIMIAFAIIGPKYDVGTVPEDEEEKGPDVGYFKALTLTLMVSRLVLVLQYASSMYFTRHYKKTRLPMALVTGTYFVAAIIYMALYWSFHKDNLQNEHSYIAWYVVAILETIVATGVSSIWRNISFKGTHLVQRMSLLTLIILGEGIMGLAKTCQKIVKSEKVLDFSASTVGNIICAVLILYFIYMLYFDWMQEDHFGTIRQQIWSFLHFPLHLTLVLAVEGINQAIAWRASVVRGNTLGSQIEYWSSDHVTWEDAAKEISEVANDLIYAAISNAKGVDQIQQGLYDLEATTNATAVIGNGDTDLTPAQNALQWLSYTLYSTIYTIGGFVPPEDKESAAAQWTTIDFSNEASVEAATDAFGKQAMVFVLTFTYFFVTIGLVVIFCCIIAALSKREKAKFHWIRLGASGAIGLGLCLLSTMSAANSEATLNATFNFILSPWILPTVTIALFAVVLLNCVKPAVPFTHLLSRHGARPAR